jgi:hypothetical protein
MSLITYSRGKKMFRKFHDGPPSNGSEDEAASSGDELRRHIGPAAHRPLTRSSIKPRLLFKEEIQQKRKLEMGPDDVDEEAVTDIEMPVTTPSSRKTRKTVALFTPFEQEATPPPTVKPKRGKVSRVDYDELDANTPSEISFDSWTRVKSTARKSSSSRDGRKRSGDHLESTAEKRTRSERSSAMDIDSF